MKQIVQEKLNLVIQQLMQLDGIDQTLYQDLTREESERIGFFARDFGMEHWDWPQGVGLFGLGQQGDVYDDYIIEWAHTELSKGLPVENINTVCPLQTLLKFPEFQTLTFEWMNQAMHNFPRTAENGFEHTSTGMTKDEFVGNQQQIWADTLFMTILFIAKMAKKYKNEEWQSEATYQTLLHLKYLVDKPTGLFYHGWDFNENSNYGNIFWCRGNSWLTMGIPLFLEVMDGQLSSEVRILIANYYLKQVHQLIALRNNQSKLWHTVLDDDTSYVEVSGSAGIVAGMYYGIRNGLLSESYLSFCEESIVGLLANVDAKGVVKGVSAGTKISRNKEDYKNIIIQPMAYGQALMICALTEYLKF